MIGFEAEILVLHFLQARMSRPEPASRTTESVACVTSKAFLWQ